MSARPNAGFELVPSILSGLGLRLMDGAEMAADVVRIDGCPVPGPLYRAVKETARNLQQMRFIGVRVSNSIVCSFEVFERREDVTDGFLMVLWISPRGD